MMLLAKATLFLFLTWGMRVTHGEELDNAVSSSAEGDPGVSKKYVDNSTEVWNDVYTSVRQCVRQDHHGVLECITTAMRNGVKEAEQREHFEMLGGLLQFDRIPVVHGTVIRTTSAEYRVGRQVEQPQESDNDLVSEVDRFTRRFTFRINLLPGVNVRAQRTGDNVNIGIVLDDDFTVTEGRGKKSKMKMKKFLPLLLIPVAIQFLMLPITLSMLKMMAMKALLASKFAFILVLVNGLWNLIVPQKAHVMSKISQEHYGYDGNLEYGAYVNRRALEERDRALWNPDLAYRGHK